MRPPLLTRGVSRRCSGHLVGDAADESTPESADLAQ
jgi:hypothetical protein